jgi:hypothetical protein
VVTTYVSGAQPMAKPDRKTESMATIADFTVVLGEAMVPNAPMVIRAATWTTAPIRSSGLESYEHSKLWSNSD